MRKILFENCCLIEEANFGEKGVGKAKVAKKAPKMNGAVTPNFSVIILKLMKF